MVSVVFGYLVIVGIVWLCEFVVVVLVCCYGIIRLIEVVVLLVIGIKEFIVWLLMLLGLGGVDLVVVFELVYLIYDVGVCLVGMWVLCVDVLI